MMARRGKGEGAIYRRKQDGRWVGSLNLGYGGGKRQRKVFYAATRAEVASALAEATRNHQRGRRPAPEVEKVGDFLSRWLEETARHNVRASTYRGYEVTLRLHIIPLIGHLKLARLRADDLDGLYSRLLKRGLSPKYVRLVHAIIHRALAHALKRDALAVNVASTVSAPSAPRKEFRTLSAEEAGRLLAEARSDRLYALYVLALTCGLRQAELLGLRWADLDLDGAVLHVRQQVYRLQGAWVFSEPKTAAGRRTISLSGRAVGALRERRRAQNAERLRATSWADLDLIFSNRLGRPTERANLQRQSFWPLLKRADLPRIRFHDLRHTCASMLLAQNVNPKIVQEMLGHSSIAVTMDVYSHAMPSLQAAAVEKMDQLFAASS